MNKNTELENNYDKKYENVNDNEEFNIYNINSIIYFIKNNFVQILLFILVFFIIFIVDYVSNINTMIFNAQAMIQNQPNKPIKESKNSKKHRTYNKK
jgi:hypothetical protein